MPQGTKRPRREAPASPVRVRPTDPAWERLRLRQDAKNRPQQFADAFHTLDLSNLSTTGEVRGTVRHHNDAIEPNFGASIAADVAQGSDGIPYLLVGGEGTVTNGAGYFQGEPVTP